MQLKELINFRVLAIRKKVYDRAAEYLKITKTKVCVDALEEMVKNAIRKGFRE